MANPLAQKPTALASLLKTGNTQAMRLREATQYLSGFALPALLFSAAALSAVTPAKYELRTARAQLSSASAKQPPLYLPSLRYVKLVAFGYYGFFSNVLWFKTLAYFGAHFESDRDYRWLGEMCDLTTSLDPRARHVYEFCSTMLAWIAKEPEKSAALLTKGIEAEPAYWRYLYLRGFNYWYFLRRSDLAEKDLTAAAALPDAPSFVASLASRLIAKEQNAQTAVSFLNELIANTNDQTAKTALRRKLKRAKISRDIELLERAIERYVNHHAQKPLSIDQLIESGMIKGIPLDPYGQPYIIDSNTGAVRTKSGKKGLVFPGRTAETGLASKEF